jgi:large subunit ribosomal protein L6
MSRIGKLEITIPQGVTVEVKNGGSYGHQEVFVTGPKGSLSQSVRHGVNTVVEDGVVKMTPADESKQNNSFHGLYRTLINKMVIGVTEGYQKALEIVGIGYRAEVQGRKLVLSLGFSHKINYEPPVGVDVTVEDQTNVKVFGYDKQKVGEAAAKIRSFREPEPYKGKGIRYKGERVKKKSTKSSK